MSWQTINSAPLETDVILFNDGVIYFGVQRKSETQDGTHWSFHGVDNVERMPYEEYCRYFEPTHWMSLPEPPELRSAESGANS